MGNACCTCYTSEETEINKYPKRDWKMPFSSIEKEFSLREKRISGAIQTSGTNFGLTYELDTEKEALSNVD